MQTSPEPEVNPAPVASVERLRGIRHVALDMDGTIYRGSTLFDFTLRSLELLREAGIGTTFLTNNPSKSVADYVAHVARMGIVARSEELFTSAQATIEFLQAHHPSAKRLFLLGTPSMAGEFASAGFEALPDDPGSRPDAVVVGFDTTLTYARLCRAAWWIQQGVLYLATNPDRVCPTDQPTVLVDCGAICAALEQATGRRPAAILGKPNPAMLQGLLHRHALVPRQLAMVGDRLYTDVEMGRRTGALGVLVLTGETTAEEARLASPPPDLVVRDLLEFVERLRAARETEA
jgi:NagD protein